MNIFTKKKMEPISKENILSGHSKRENNWWPLQNFLPHCLVSKSEYTQNMNALMNVKYPSTRARET